MRDILRAINARRRLDLYRQLAQRTRCHDGRAVFGNITEPADDRLEGRWLDVDAAHAHHVVGPRQNAAFEPRERPSAHTCSRTPHDNVPRAIPN